MLPHSPRGRTRIVNGEAAGARRVVAHGDNPFASQTIVHASEELSIVSDEDIIADYCVTEVYNTDVIKKRIESLPQEILAQVSAETMAVAANSTPATMRRYLKWSLGWCFRERMERLGFSECAQNELVGLLSVSEG